MMFTQGQNIVMYYKQELPRDGYKFNKCPFVILDTVFAISG